VVPTKSSAISHLSLIELTDQLAIGHLFSIWYYSKKDFDIFHFIIIMRINPITSSPAVSTLEEKKPRVYRSNYWPSTGCRFSPGQNA